MVALQIRDVPEPVRDVLAGLAAERGQSLQAFLLQLVEREAAMTGNRDLFRDYVLPDGGVSGEFDAVELIREMRDERERYLVDRHLQK